MKLLTKIRLILVLFIVSLAISGLTAFPIQSEIMFLNEHLNIFPAFFSKWIQQLFNGIMETPDFMFYGTDWLAFAHLVLALFFIPVYFDPLRYKANIDIAMIACVGIIPLAFICGSLRDIPFFHQLIDCSFGIIGLIPLITVRHLINKININLISTT